MNHNHISNINEFPCRIIGLRHGLSKANAITLEGAERRGVVVSHPENGIKEEWGLTEEGRMTVETNVHKALEDGILDENILIISSDFKRTKESALIAAEILNIPADKIQYNISLRERFFGDWEGKSGESYPKVWYEDERNPNHKEYNVESVNEVLERTTKLLQELLKTPEISGKTVLLVSHGDTLQIMETAFKKIPASKHRELPVMKPGEIRIYTGE